MVKDIDFQVDQMIKDALIKNLGEATKYEPDFIEKYPVLEQLKAKVIYLKKEKERYEKLIDEKPLKFRLEKIAEIESEIKFYFDVLELLGKQQEFIQHSYDTFSNAIHAYLKGSEILKEINFCKELLFMERDEAGTLMDINIELLEKLKNISKTGELPDTQKLKEFYSKLKVKLSAVVNKINQKINE